MRCEASYKTHRCKQRATALVIDRRYGWYGGSFFAVCQRHVDPGLYYVKEGGVIKIRTKGMQVSRRYQQVQKMEMRVIAGGIHKALAQKGGGKKMVTTE